MGDRPRVLIVDDEELILRALTRTLVRAGYDVVARPTLAGAKEALSTEVVDVVLTDLRLGTGTGLDMVRIACAIDPAPGVIVFSGATGPEDIAAAMQAGAHAVVRKPVAPADLVAAVAAAMRR